MLIFRSIEVGGRDGCVVVAKGRCANNKMAILSLKENKRNWHCHQSVEMGWDKKERWPIGYKSALESRRKCTHKMCFSAYKELPYETYNDGWDAVLTYAQRRCLWIVTLLLACMFVLCLEMLLLISAIFGHLTSAVTIVFLLYVCLQFCFVYLVGMDPVHKSPCRNKSATSLSCHFPPLLTGKKGILKTELRG